MIAAIEARLYSQASITAPTGWTLIRRDSSPSGYVSLSQALYFKVAGAGEPASYTWSFWPSTGATATIVAYSGVDQLNPVDAHSGRFRANTKRITAPDVITTRANTVVIGVFGHDGTALIQRPVGMTERATSRTGGSPLASEEDADSVQPSSGDTGIRTATSERASSNIGQLVALRPAANPTPAPPPTLTPPVDLLPPTVSGTAQAGQTLAADAGFWSGSEAAVYSYLWMRCDAAGANCAPISGATARTYVLSSADVGHTMRVSVRASNSVGSNSADSAPTSVVANAVNPPANTVSPSLTGTARDGSTLSVSTGTWTSAEPLTYTYRWSRCDNAAANCAALSSPVGASYVLTTADVRSTIVATVTATNSAGSNSAASAPSAIVQAATLPTPQPTTCDRTLTSGSVSNFVNSLASGQRGCLQGTFTENVTVTKAGVTLQSAPGTTAAICGYVTIEDSADDVTLRGLRIDGSCAGSSYNTIYLRGERTLLENNDIINGHKGQSCLLIGQSPTGWQADNVTIRGNRIHQCGTDPTRDQGIYVHETTGTLIEDNTIYDISAFAMQFWGDVRNSIYRYNVSDGGAATYRGGLVVGADSGPLPADNLVENNIVTHTDNAAFEGWGGSNNVVRGNCVWQNGGGTFSGSGWTDGGNLRADPLFVNWSTYDYRLSVASPCTGKGPQ
jgi:parallel beta helix pectate lyase-like protein